MNEYLIDELNVGKEEFFRVKITEEKVEQFAMITGDYNPLHTNDFYAMEKGFSQKVVYGMLTTSFFSTLAGMYLPGKYSLIQGVELKLVKPVYINDELIVKGTVEEIHQSVQTIDVRVEIFNQIDEKVVKGKMRIGFLC